jgi:RNA polymerase sigma-70 factor (ECF subfamily)
VIVTGGRTEKRPAAALDRKRAAQLEAAFRAVQPDLVAYLRVVVGASAEDVASQTWVDALASADRFSGDADDLRRWLFTIARRRSIDHRRRWWQRRVSSLAPDQLEPAAAAIDESADREATRWALSQIARLPADQAEVVLLRVVAGFTADDVAGITGRTPNAVRVIQHRALRRLARELGDLPEDEV